MAQRKPRDTIGLILSNVTNDFSGHLIEQMSNAFAAHDYRLIVTATNHSIDGEREMLRTFSKMTDGILIISDSTEYAQLQDFVPTNVPVIFLNRKPEGCPHTCIIENDYTAVYQAILSSCAKGNDKIALICTNPNFSTTKEILNAYRNAMESTHCGFHEDWIYYTGSHMQFDVAALSEDIIKKGCNTILASTQTVTKCLWDYLLVCNLNTPDSLNLIGFSNKDTDSQAASGYDRIAQPVQELVELAVQQMLYLLHNPKTPAREYLLKGVMVRQTLDVLHPEHNQEDL